MKAIKGMLVRDKFDDIAPEEIKNGLVVGYEESSGVISSAVATAAVFMDRINEVEEAEELYYLLAEISELLNLADMYSGREISRKQIQLKGALGAFDDVRKLVEE